MNKKPASYKAPAIGRAAAVMDHIAKCSRPPTLSDLSRALGYGKSTLHGLLRAMEDEQWVMCVDGKYRLGAGLLALARKAYGEWDVARLARPFMEQLSDRLGESVCVGRVEAKSVRIDDCVEGHGEMRIALKQGFVLPPLAGAVGKAIVAGLSPQEAAKTIVPGILPRFTERSVTAPAEYLGEVENCRALGYATDKQEYLRGVSAVAAPISSQGRTVAVLWVVGLSVSFTPEAMAAAGEELARAAQTISGFLVADNPEGNKNS